MYAKRNTMMNFFYAPAIVLFIIFVIVPFFEGVRISFTDWTGFLPDYRYVGLNNYIRFISDSEVLRVFINTVVYGFGSTIFQNIIGLAFAVYLNAKFRGRGIVRTIIYLPVMIAPLIMGYIMFYVLQYRSGALNDLVMIFGAQAVDWLSTPTRTVLILTTINTLQFVGVSMVIYLAGLQNIPKIYLEAADIDGASSIARFRHITFPLLLPAITSSVVINLIGGLKLFDIIRALTSVSPTTGAHSLSTYLTYQYFNVQRAGYAAVLGIFVFFFILIVNITVIRYFDRKEEKIL